MTEGLPRDLAEFGADITAKNNDQQEAAPRSERQITLDALNTIASAQDRDYFGLWSADKADVQQQYDTIKDQLAATAASHQGDQEIQNAYAQAMAVLDQHRDIGLRPRGVLGHNPGRPQTDSEAQRVVTQRAFQKVAPLQRKPLVPKREEGGKGSWKSRLPQNRVSR